MTGQVKAPVHPVRRDRQDARGREHPLLLALAFENPLDGGEHLAHGPVGQDQRPPGHPQADAERCLVGPAAADVADQCVHPAVRRLHHVVEVAAEQALAATGPVAGRHGHPRVRQQRRGQQATLQPGVLPGENLRLLQLALRLLQAPPFDRVADDPVQEQPVDLALDQVVLRSGADRRRAQMLVGQPGQDYHGDGGQLLVQPADAVQLMRVRQAKIEQHAADSGRQRGRLGQRPGAVGRDRSPGLEQELFDNKRVAVVVLDEQHLDMVRCGNSGRLGRRDIPGYHEFLIRYISQLLVPAPGGAGRVSIV